MEKVRHTIIGLRTGKIVLIDDLSPITDKSARESLIALINYHTKVAPVKGVKYDYIEGYMLTMVGKQAIEIYEITGNN